MPFSESNSSSVTNDLTSLSYRQCAYLVNKNFFAVSTLSCLGLDKLSTFTTKRFRE